MSYSKVPHAVLEALCAAPCRRGRTKDLVWLVYRHTLGRSAGVDTGRGWRASGPALARSLGVDRSTANRSRAEALDAGLISVGEDGSMYVGVARCFDRLPLFPTQIAGSQPWCSSAPDRRSSAPGRRRSAPERRSSAPDRRSSAPQTGPGETPKKRIKNKEEKKRFPTSIQPLPSELRQPFLSSIRNKTIELSHIDEHYTALNEQIEIAYLSEDRERLQALNTWRIKVEVTEHPL